MKQWIRRHGEYSLEKNTRTFKNDGFIEQH